MNKKYVKYAALILGLAFVNQSFPMDNKQSQRTKDIASALASIGFTYGFCRFILPEVYKRITTYEDASPETQQWAKKVMQDCGEDIGSIPLKKGTKGDGWSVKCGSVITVPENFDLNKCSEQELLQHMHSLKHEFKHFKNNDHANRAAMVAATISFGGLLTQESSSFLTKPAIVFTGYGVDMAYTRYRESEADRFGYEKATSREELEATKNMFLNQGACIKYALLTDPTMIEGNFVENKILSVLSQKIKNNIQSEASATLNDPLKIKEMLNKQENFFDAAVFVMDREHPSWKSRADMAQDYIDKWDEKYRKKLSAADLKFNKAV